MLRNQKPRPTEATLGAACTVTGAAPPIFKAHAQALRLIEMGARASLVCQLTSMPRATVKTLYQLIHGRPSPSGLAPFSDTWHVQTNHRVLHTNIVWKLGVEAARLANDPAQRLIAVYDSYSCAVSRPLLSIMRAYFVPRLLTIEAWRIGQCKECGMAHIGPVSDLDRLCPACTLQRLYRCPKCNAAFESKKLGRRTRRCLRCRSSVH